MSARAEEAMNPSRAKADQLLVPKPLLGLLRCCVFISVILFGLPWGTGDLGKSLAERSPIR